MSMWIKLENGIYLFGEGGITRVERHEGFDIQQKPITGTILYSGTVRIATTKHTVERIQELLEQHYGY